jgi:hypothetical protein
VTQASQSQVRNRICLCASIYVVCALCAYFFAITTAMLAKDVISNSRISGYENLRLTHDAYITKIWFARSALGIAESLRGAARARWSGASVTMPMPAGIRAEASSTIKIDRNAAPPSGVFIYVEAGVPLRTIYGTVELARDGEARFHYDSIHGSITESNSGPPVRGRACVLVRHNGDVRMIPLYPMCGALALEAGLMSTLIAILWLLYKWLRGRYRLWSERCVTCGYSLVGNSGVRCPECGKLASARSEEGSGSKMGVWVSGRREWPIPPVNWSARSSSSA